MACRGVDGGAKPAEDQASRHGPYRGRGTTQGAGAGDSTPKPDIKITSDGNTYMYQIAVFDTGADTHIFQKGSASMMSDTRTSDLRVRGAFGPEVQQGLKKGTLHAYVMSPGNQEGAALDFTVDTVDNTNDSLFSFREMFEEQGWSAHLCRPPQFCGMSRKNPKTGKDERMPLVYNWKLHQFELHYIVCKDAATAAKVGRDQNNNFRMKQPPYMGSAGRGRQPVSTSQSAVTSGSILDILEPNPITGTHSVMALSLDGEQFGREMRHNEQEGRGRSQIRVVAGDYEYASARAGQKVLHSVPTSAEAASADKRGKQQVDALEEPVNGEYLTSDSTLADIKYDVGRKEAMLRRVWHERTK